MRTQPPIACAGLAGLLFLVTAACEEDRTSDLIGPEAEPPVVSVAFAADSLPADGASTVVATVTVENMARQAPNMAQVTISAGRIVGTSAETRSASLFIDSLGVGIVRIQSPSTTGPLFASAQFTGAVGQDSIMIVDALPDRIEIVPADFELNAGPGDKIDVVVQLYRSLGSVSPGLKIDLVVIDSTATPLGEVFGKGVSDTTGKASVSYSTGSSAYVGPIRLIASTVGRTDRDEIADTAVVWVTPVPASTFGHYDVQSSPGRPSQKPAS